ncbi:hypothetical protein AVEN_55063-1 [Araneus ventricosus]|uniref:Uncharacterized protein n=1 Tax=Araneus ventricosus TaxID=182803 RepID=A0A4Y2GT58_ARAVE|nr:hypothetical protein AVEN_55063-1 [Araneus ventricosus]
MLNGFARRTDERLTSTTRNVAPFQKIPGVIRTFRGGNDLSSNGKGEQQMCPNLSAEMCGNSAVLKPNMVTHKHRKSIQHFWLSERLLYKCET